MQQQFCVLLMTVLQKSTWTTPSVLFQTRRQVRNSFPQTQPEASRAGVQNHGQHAFLQGGVQLPYLRNQDPRGVRQSHIGTCTTRDRFSYCCHSWLFISSRWRGFKCQRTCQAIFPCSPRKCIFFISRQNVKPTNNFSAINFVWVNKGFCLGQFLVYNDQVG